MKSILLITEQFDPNVDNLIQVLLQRGIPYLRWNLDRYPQDSSLTYQATAMGFEGAIETDGRIVSFDDIGSVWYRAYRASGFPAGLNPDQREFAEHEAEMVLEALPLVTNWQRSAAPPASNTQAGSALYCSPIGICHTADRNFK